jgi:ribosomal protein S18 acetylase RimI-like enzyme
MVGKIYWNGLEIDTLWVDNNFQRKGIGKQLMREAEGLAIKYGVVIAFLKTVEAKEFCEKLGYEVYGILEDRPIGSILYHMKKQIKTRCATFPVKGPASRLGREPLDRGGG